MSRRKSNYQNQDIRYKNQKPKKASLPLVGTNYDWFDYEKGVGGTNMRDTIPRSDNDPRVSGHRYFINKNVQYRWYVDPTFKGNNTYNYIKIDPSRIYDRVKKYEKLERASYIPYITTTKGNYWLLGSFHDFNDIKVDFGGSCEKYENPNDCATRELGEETQKVLLDPVKDAVDQGKLTVFKGYNIHPDSNKRVIFIMVNIDGNFEMLDDIQATIDARFDEKFANKQPGKDDLFGPLGFHRENDVFRFKTSDNRTLYTALNLTDFIEFYRNYKINHVRKSLLN